MARGGLRLLLDPKHKLFADKYLETGRIQASAVHAGYKGTSAHVSGNRLLKRADVQQYLSEQAAKVTEHQEDLQTKVIKELSDMAFVNIADFVRVGPDGELLADFSNATPEQLKSITSLATKQVTRTQRDGTEETERSARYGFADKYRGLELLGKHLGMFKEPEQRVVLDVADRLLAARRRLLENDQQGVEVPGYEDCRGVGRGR